MTVAAARRERLLVIDDDPGLAEVIELLLEREGYAVQHASTMKRGVELAGSEEFELVVTDLKLPDGTGLDAITGSGPSVPGCRSS
jgi:DNA-binding response OmpR family regulator